MGTWIKLDDEFMDHPKVADAGHMAALLYVGGLCYCSRHLTDGRIPKSVVPRLTDVPKPLVAARRLVEVGLWLDEGSCYVVHDYDDYQRTAEQVGRERDTARFRKRDQRSRNGNGHANVTAMSRRDMTVTSPSRGHADVTAMSRRRPGELRLSETEAETEWLFNPGFPRDPRRHPQADVAA